MEDPFLRRRRALPLRRAWIAQPHGEEEIIPAQCNPFGLEVIPALQGCLERVEEIDQCLLVEQELLLRWRLEVERDGLAALQVAMLQPPAPGGGGHPQPRLRPGPHTHRP